MGIDPRVFGANIHLLIGLLVVGGLLIFLIIASWTGLKIKLWQRAQRREEQRQHAERFQPDGTPYPPASRGICEECGEYSDRVYHLPDGGRLCPDHFREYQERNKPT